MHIKIKYTILIACSTLLFSCSSDITDDPIPKEASKTDEIQLSSLNSQSSLVTRAELNDFPNGGNIGVIGALYSQAPINWNSYSDLDNVPANAASVEGDLFNFNWVTQKYWPFDGSQLVFMAYSPFTDNGIGADFFIESHRRNLNISLHDGMPDIMYASGNVNAETTPYNKLSGKVNLGEFKHIMSKLTVEVAAQDGMNPNIVVNNLAVRTTTHQALFFMELGDSGLSTLDTPDEPFSYTLVDGPTPFVNPSISHTMFLFPGTEESVRIAIGLVDTTTGSSIDQVFLVSSFNNLTNSGEPLTLERAKNTTLRIEVNSVPVREDEDKIILRGTLTDWNQKGNFGIHIN